MDTTILPTPPTSGAIFSSTRGYDDCGRGSHCVEELLLHKAINDGRHEEAVSRGVLGAAIERSAGEEKLNSAIVADRIGDVVNRTTLANLLAIKETQRDVDKESCKTREVLGTRMDVIEKEILERTHRIEIEALRNTCAIEKRIDDCCEDNRKEAEKTRDLIRANRTKELEDRLHKAEMLLAINKLGRCGRREEEDNGHGH